MPSLALFVTSGGIAFRSRRPRATDRLRPASASYVVRFGEGGVKPSVLQGVVFSVRAATPVAAQAPQEHTVATEDGAEYRLSAGERARTLVHVCETGTLCTASIRHDGVPFGTHIDYILGEDGSPIFLLAKSAAHTKNLGTQPRCSLYCQPTSSAGQDGCRATLVGEIEKLDPDLAEEVRELYIEKHAHAVDALKYPDLFTFHKMNVKDVYFVGGYGVVAQWVRAQDFAHGVPDPLCFDAPEIVPVLNEEKADDLKRLSRVFLGAKNVDSCTMTGLDRLGFDLRVRDVEGDTREYRVAFRESVSNRFDAQSALVKAFQEAWERESGFEETWTGEDTRPTVLYYSTPKKASAKE